MNGVREREFVRVQGETLRHYGLEATSRFLDVDAIGGRAHVLAAGDGPPVVLVIGGGLPAAMWAPLMATLDGFRLHAVDLPGLGLTDPVTYSTPRLRSLAVEFLDEVRVGLGIERCLVIGQSIGGQWATWMALDRPERVAERIGELVVPFLRKHAPALETGPASRGHHHGPGARS